MLFTNKIKRALTLCAHSLQGCFSDGEMPLVDWICIAESLNPDEKATTVALLYGAIADGSCSFDEVTEMDFDEDILYPLSILCERNGLSDEEYYARITTSALAWKVLDTVLFFKGLPGRLSDPHKQVNYWNRRTALRKHLDVPQITNQPDDIMIQEKILLHRRFKNNILGAFLGASLGDACGYGICQEDGLRYLSSYSQEMLFASNGVLYAQTRQSTWGFETTEEDYIYYALRDWAYTKTDYPNNSISWISSIKELHEYRHPDIQTIASLLRGRYGTFKKPVSTDNKSAAALPRVVPLVLLHKNISKDDNVKNIMLKAAKVAAITHGHKTAWLSAALLAHLLSRSIYGRSTTGQMLNGFLKESKQYLFELFGDSQELRNLYKKIDKAVLLAANQEKTDDEINIKRIGKGWNSDDALAIALYCALRHPLSYLDAVTAATRHDGNKAGTGFLTGLLLGAKLGVDHFVPWLKDLQLKGLLFEIGRDLVEENHLSRYSEYSDSVWKSKYISCDYTLEKNG